MVIRKTGKLIISAVFLAAVLFVSNIGGDAAAAESSLYSVSDMNITYESFGAKGDGITNDAEAIRKAHEAANELYEKTGICPTVYGSEGAAYYVGNVDPTIVIKTNVDWKHSTFILDDYIDDDNDGENDINCSNDIFAVKSIHSFLNIGAPEFLSGINPTAAGTQMTEMTDLLDYLSTATAKDIRENGGVWISEAMLENDIRPGLMQSDKLLLHVVNDNLKQFRRKGIGSGGGTSQQEFFLIDRSGRVLNDIFEEFDSITKIVVYPVDKTPLTISNGRFITRTYNDVIDNNGKLRDYTWRGIQICRANVTLDKIDHILDEAFHEIEPVSPQTNGQGNRYLGFIRTYSGTVHFTLKNSTITPHQSPYQASSSYDIALNNAVGIHLDNVSYGMPDSNSKKWYTEYIANVDARWKRWGVSTSNYAKDVVIENSCMNRIDSHNGIWNLKVKDTTVGQYGFTLIGGGEFLADNVKFDGSNYAISLRGDYGSTWKGSMVLKDVEMILPVMKPMIITYENDGSWDYGYKCYFPNLTIQNLTIDDTILKTSPCLIPIYKPDGNANNSPYYFSQYIKADNIKLKSGRSMTIFPSDDYLEMSLYGSGEKTKICLSDISLAEGELERYNHADSQFDISYTDK